MIFPPSLKKGSSIGLIAPAGRFDNGLLVSVVEAIKVQGFNPVVGMYPSVVFFQFSATDGQRLDDLQSMLDSDEIDAILCIRGGYGTMRVLGDLKFDKFILKPKWVVGFSDITALHACLQSKTDVVSVHGPMAKHIVDAEPGRADIEALWQILRGGMPVYEHPYHPKNRMGKASGKLIGGNLSLLYALRGTPYDMAPDGAVLFIEDLNEYLYHLDRMMQNLRLGGVLQRLSGLIIGQFTDIKDNDNPFGATVEEIILDAVKDYGYPVMFGFPAGHSEPNFPLPIGATVHLEVSELVSRISFDHGRAQ